MRAKGPTCSPWEQEGGWPLIFGKYGKVIYINVWYQTLYSLYYITKERFLIFNYRVFQYTFYIVKRNYSPGNWDNLGNMERFPNIIINYPYKKYLPYSSCGFYNIINLDLYQFYHVTHLYILQLICPQLVNLESVF